VVGALTALTATFFAGRTDDGGNDEAASWARPGQLDNAELVAHGDLVCSTTRQNELFCVQADSGDTVFSEQLAGAATSPTLVDDTLVVAVDAADDRGDLYGYSLRGDLLWEATDLQDVAVDDTAMARPELPAVDQIVAVPLVGPETFPTGLVGVDAATGTEVWRALTSGGLTGPVGNVLSDGARFYALALSDTDAWMVVALDAASGAELWRYELAAGGDDPAFLRGAAPVANGSAVALAFSGQPAQVVVLDAATGGPRWAVPITGNDALVANVEGVTVVLDTAFVRGFDDAGAELWTAPAPEGGVVPNGAMPGAVAELVVERDEVYTLGLHVVWVDTTDGTLQQVHTQAFAGDVAVAADHLVVAGSRLEGAPLEQPS
jgi:outer membrane protein assembly factor BamB